MKLVLSTLADDALYLYQDLLKYTKICLSISYGFKVTHLNSRVDARVVANVDGRTYGRTYKRTENRIPISRLA